MRPSFEAGELLLVTRAAYRGSAPRRGDVAVLRDPRDSARRVMKRVVGLPGETIRIEDGVLFADGEALMEPYLAGLPSSLGLEEKAWDLQADQYVVLGDNRARSTDSRSFGPVGDGSILGRASFRLWPLRAWGRV